MNYPYYQNPMYYQQNYQQAQQPDERLWVQGEEAAKAYLVAPNAFVRLWDSQCPVFYEKRADSTGRPYMEIFEYTRKGSNKPSVTTGGVIDYGERLKAIEGRLEALEQKGDAENVQ